MQKYNNPAGGTPSSVGTQFQTFFYIKQALIEARKEQYFTQLANTTAMPKNMGKTLKRYHYIPILDSQNLNDQGIDANGALLSLNKSYVVLPSTTIACASNTEATTLAGLINQAGAGLATVSNSNVNVTTTDIPPVLNATAEQIKTIVRGALIQVCSGNLYSSSKDIGTIPGKMPVISETGGRVNRVGHKRKELQGTFEKFGFFDEYTQESLDFDTDAELMTHINRELLNAANEMTEDALQLDLISSAGVVRYAGAATSTATVAPTHLVTYGDLMRLSIDLDNNRCPKHTTVITGTRNIDTKTVPACRVMYCGSELLPTLRAMKDLHDQPAFIPVEKYAAGTTTMTGEVGAVDQFRIVIVPEMMKWEGKGVVTADTTVYTTNGRVDVFPMLVVGDESFTTIGFQTDGNGGNLKFKITHKTPSDNIDRNDPYGEMGFTSIKWYYGFMLLRPERLALVKTAAKL
ncbi:MAG: N4-gp56 family major capsid protein [Prevotella sp.]